MRRTIHSVLSGLVLLAGPFLIASEAMAQAGADTAEVWIVHGIPDADVPGPDQVPADFPLNVSRNGESCSTQPLTYKQVRGPFPIPVGEHAIAFYAGSDTTCEGTPLLSLRISAAAFETSTVVAHLDQNGVITANKLTNKLSTVPEGRARLAAVHTAAAPPVDIRIEETVGGTDLVIRDVENGDQTFGLDLTAQDYDIFVSPAVSGDELADPILGPTTVTLTAGTANTVYVVGTPPSEANGGTLTAIPQTITPQ